MGFYIPASLLPQQNKKTSKEAPNTDRLDLILLANGKRMGFSLCEINEFRARDFVEITNIYSGKSPASKKASQQDIDKFLN